MTRISQNFQFKKSQDYVRVLVMEDMIHSNTTPNSKVHGANMVMSAPDGPHIGPMNLAIRDYQDDVNPTMHPYGQYQMPLKAFLTHWIYCKNIVSEI